MLCKIIRPAGPDGVSVVRIGEGSGQAYYLVRAIHDAEGRAFAVLRLTAPEAYYVRQTGGVTTCDCIGFTGAGKCRHIHGVQAVIGSDVFMGAIELRPEIPRSAKPYVRPQFPPKNNPSDDESFYSEWASRHPYCAACRGIGSETHHIVKQGRSHEACNLLRLCRDCHNLAEGLDVRGPDGVLLPKITIGIALTLKWRADPGEYDPDRLQELRGKRLPDPEPIPERWRW